MPQLKTERLSTGQTNIWAAPDMKALGVASSSNYEAQLFILDPQSGQPSVCWEVICCYPFSTVPDGCTFVGGIADGNGARAYFIRRQG